MFGSISNDEVLDQLALKKKKTKGESEIHQRCLDLDEGNKSDRRWEHLKTCFTSFFFK